jgi:Flp pilus assembly protein TadD
MRLYPSFRILRALPAAALLWTAFQTALAQESGPAQCGSLENPVGPMDYNSRTPVANKLRKDVEDHHFNGNVRTLRGGQTATNPMGDLDYVLRAFPNHPQALMLVSKYQANGGKQGRFRSAECYFDRAKRFTPRDPAVHLLFGIYLAQRKENDRALAAYQTALAIAPDYAEAHYNLGLLLVDLGRLDEARMHAEKAYDLGYPLRGLRNQLERRNAWRSQSAPPPGLTEPSSASSAEGTTAETSP